MTDDNISGNFNSNKQSTATPVVYEDRIRISRSKFESLFGWKAATDGTLPVVHKNDDSQRAVPIDDDDDDESGADDADADDSSRSVQSEDGATLMPSCICEIMRENRVTVVPAFRKSFNSNSSANNVNQSNQSGDNNKNKRDYVLRIFGDNDSDVSAAKFKIQSAVHQVAVMGSTMANSENVNNNNELGHLPFHPSTVGNLPPRMVANSLNSESSLRSSQWWANVNDRLTLRIDVDYTVHSHLIGRNGGNIASVMRATQTHIHFPDSNKQSSANSRAGSSGSRSASPSLNPGGGFSSTPLVKNNYVTISGPSIDQVDEARQYIRRMTPLRLAIPFSSLHVPLSLTGQVFVPARLAASSRRVMQEFCDRGLSAAMRSDSLVITGTMSIADLVIQATQQICLEVYECLVPVSLSVDVTPRDWAFVRGPGDSYVRKIEHTTGCQFLFPPPNGDDTRQQDGRRQPVRIIGFPANAVKARLLLHSRLPIQFSWPLRSHAASVDTESDGALKEIVATRYDIFLSMRDRSGRGNGGLVGMSSGLISCDSGSATPDITVGSSVSSRLTSNRPASSGAAAYHMVQPKHIVLKSFEGNLPNVYRFYAYMRELQGVSSSRTGSRLDDLTETAPPTPPQSPSWWIPLPSDNSDDELFQKVDALVHESCLLATRSNPSFAAPPFPATPAPSFNILPGNPMLANDPQVIYAAYNMAVSQQQQRQQQQQASAAVIAALANGWAPSYAIPGAQPAVLAAKHAGPTTVLGRGAHFSQAHRPIADAPSRPILSQRNAEPLSHHHSQLSTRGGDDRTSSPESNSSGSLENYNIVIDEKVINTTTRPSTHASAAASNEGRAITGMWRAGGQAAVDGLNEARKEVTDRMLEQFAASLSRLGTDNTESSPDRPSSSAVVVSAESHKIYEVPRRFGLVPGGSPSPNSADRMSHTSDPIASGILQSVIAASETAPSKIQPAPTDSQAKLLAQQRQLRFPTANNCGLLFSLSQPANIGLVDNQASTRPPTTTAGQQQRFSGDYGASSIIPSAKQNPQPNSEQISSALMGSVGSELLASRASSFGSPNRGLSITGGFATKLQATELYYEQFADQIDQRLGTLLTRGGINRSDIGKLASQEINLETFVAMSENDLRDCGIWQLGVRRQLLRIITDLQLRTNTTESIKESSKEVGTVVSNAKDKSQVSASSGSDDQRFLSANSSCNGSTRPTGLSDPSSLSNNSSHSASEQQQQLPNIDVQQQQQQPMQQMPPQSPPFFASLKTYRLESEFRLL